MATIGHGNRIDHGGGDDDDDDDDEGSYWQVWCAQAFHHLGHTHYRQEQQVIDI